MILDIQTRIKREESELLEKVAEAVLRGEGQDFSKIEVSLTMISSKDMRAVNKRTRENDKVTDVLSFPSLHIKAGEIINFKSEESIISMDYDTNKLLLGDILICKTVARRQAKEYENSLTFELIKLTIHSLLHLLGYDHIKDSDFKIMKEKEEKYMVEFEKLR
ncbi:MAG: rRNA maturation RNase YbeY [Clostridia bacterium]